MSRSRDWLVLALIAAAFSLYLTLKPARQSAKGTRHPAVGVTLHYLELQPLTGDSRRVSLSDLAGKVVVLNFWGTWCGPCVQEFPHIVNLAARYSGRDDFRLLAVSCGMDTDADLDPLRAETQAFLKNVKAGLPTYADQHFSSRRNLIMVANLDDFFYPTTLILDRQGVIRGMWEGYSSVGVQEMQGLVDQLLNEKTPSAERVSAK